MRVWYYWGGILLGFAVGVWLFFDLQHEKIRVAELQKTQIQGHWRETGISLSDLQSFLEPEVCYSSQRKFLACMNSLLQIAQRMNFDLAWRGPGNLMVEPHSSGSTGTSWLFQTEKEMLSPWKERFNIERLSSRKIDFKSMARQLVQMQSPSLQPHFIGSGINAFLSVARDPHTYILPRSYYENVIMSPNPEARTFGFSLGKRNDRVIIKKVIEGSEASRQGLKAGDEVVAVQGFPIHSLTFLRLSEIMRSALESKLAIKLQRSGQQFNLRLMAQIETQAAVESEVFGDVTKVGVLHVHKFAEETCEMAAKNIKSLKRSLVQGIILDLRDNPGGSIDEAGCLVSLFIGVGQTAYTTLSFNSEEAPEVAWTNEKKLYEGRLAVLVNSASASAAELVAGSLQAHQRALVLGQRTYGKGSFQEGRLWKRNKEILLFETKGFYYLPTGESPQMTGIVPDLSLALSDEIQAREGDQFISAWPGALTKGAGLSGLKLTHDFKRKPSTFDLMSCVRNEFDANSPPQVEGDPLLLQSIRILDCQKQHYADSANKTL